MPSTPRAMRRPPTRPEWRLSKPSSRGRCRRSLKKSGRALSRWAWKREWRWRLETIKQERDLVADCRIALERTGKAEWPCVWRRVGRRGSGGDCRIAREQDWEEGVAVASGAERLGEESGG